MTGAAGTDALRTMLLIRTFEERCVELYSAAKIRGFLHLYIGEEAVAAGIMPALEPTDRVVSTYREHGHALLRGVSMGSSAMSVMPSRSRVARSLPVKKSACSFGKRS